MLIQDPVERQDEDRCSALAIVLPSGSTSPPLRFCFSVRLRVSFRLVIVRPFIRLLRRFSQRGLYLSTDRPAS
jgi:hypothetical protein